MVEPTPQTQEELSTTPQLNKHQQLKKMREILAEEESLFMSMLKEKATKSLYHFNKYILMAEKGDDTFSKLAPFHKVLCNFVQDRPDKRKLILIPRSHLKTKMVTVGYPTMKICNNPKIRVLIYSATWQMAVDIHSNIQKNLKNTQRIHQLYGDISEGAKEWAQDRTRLAVNDKREPTITAAGIDNNLVGGHYDLIILDDVVNRDNVGTMEQILKVITRYKDCLDLLEPHGELIVIGTRWHDSDLYGWITDPSNQAMDNYLTLESVGHPEIMRAFQGSLLSDDGFIPLWPGKFTRKDFLAKLKEEGWAHFSSQYLNDPVPEEDAVFKRTWFKNYTSDDIKGTILNKFLLIDPALSLSKEADFTAMGVIGVDEWNNVYVLELVKARLSPHDLIEEIFRLQEKWPIIDTGLEQVAFQKVIGYSLRDDPRFKKKPFHITELKPNERSKDQRIKGLQPLYENGKVFHDPTDPNTVFLEDELVRFPRSKYDDLIDMLSYGLDLIFPARQKSIKHRKRGKYLY